jgi:hypothetical protein
MAKETHRVRVWAERDAERRLEFSQDAQLAREAALLVVDRLQHDEAVDSIEMEEHVVLSEETDGTETRARRGALRWVRSGDHWREVPA